MRTEDRISSFGLLILRLVVGVIFTLHGAQKLFQGGLPRFADSLARMGIPAPSVAAVMVAMVEFVGGVLLMVGMLTRPAAARVALDMVVAIVGVHLPRGFFNQAGGMEFPLSLLAANVALVCLGAGAWSVDGWLHAGHGSSTETRTPL